MSSGDFWTLIGVMTGSQVAVAALVIYLGDRSARKRVARRKGDA